MTTGKLLSNGERFLNEYGIDSNDALILLSHATGKEPSQVLAHPLDTVHRPASVAHYKKYLRLRIQGFSVAAITGYKYFYGIRIRVNRYTLIPRPESELLVEHGLEYLKATPRARVLDMGTGSGCISIALATTARKDNTYTATDVSLQALKIARSNARAHRAPIHFIHSDLFDRIARAKKFDLIVANLPYLTTRQLNEPSIRKEPTVALQGGADGLTVYRKFFHAVTDFCSPCACIVIEMDPAQSVALQRLVTHLMPTSSISIHRDLAGYKRSLKIQLNREFKTPQKKTQQLPCDRVTLRSNTT